VQKLKQQAAMALKSHLMKCHHIELIHIFDESHRHAICIVLTVNEDCGLPHCCSLWRLHPGSSNASRPSRL